MKLMDKEVMKPSIFGMFDGLTSLLGVLIPLLNSNPVLIFRTCIGLTVSSAISMGLGEFISSDKTIPKNNRVHNSIYMAVFTAIGCIAPVLPYLFTRGLSALVISALIYLVLTVIVAYMKSSDLGWKSAISQTFSISFLAVLSVVLLTLVLPVPAG